MNPGKLEDGFWRINAGIPYTLPYGHEDIDVPTFWLLLYSLGPRVYRSWISGFRCFLGWGEGGGWGDLRGLGFRVYGFLDPKSM